jgi:hypothetical protein
VRSPTTNPELPPSKKNDHDKNLEPHKKSNILSVTLHSGRAPNSPLQPVPVAEIAHLAGELFGTPENPIHPAPKNLPAPIVSVSTDATNTDEDAMETEDKKPAAIILKNQSETAEEDEMEIDDKKPAAIEKGSPPQSITQDSRSTSVPPVSTIAEPINSSQTREMETDDGVEFTPPSEADPLHQLNERIERTKNYLRRLEEAIATAKGVPPATVPGTQNPYLSAALSQPKAPPPATATVIAPSQPLTIPPPNPDPSPFARLAATRPTYPKIPDPSPKRPFFSRYTWRIDIPANVETPQKGFVQAVLEIWTVLKEADDKLILYPWRMRDHGQHKPLTNPAKIPGSKDGITRYFRDAYFRPHPGPMYIKVFMGYSLPDAELGKQTQHFFGTTNNKNRVGMWKSQLQFEDVVTIGWLYRSTPGMSPETISRELFAHTGIQASLRWQMISLDIRGKMDKELEVKALHISVRREDANLAKAKFVRLVFAKHRRSHFIGGSPMRLIPIIKDLSPANKEKCKWIRQKQGEFHAALLSSEVFDITNIDGQAVGLNGRTLRDLILEIPLKRNLSKQAFLSADRSFNQSSTKLFYYKDDRAECHNRVSTLLPFLIFTNPTLEKGIRGCFSAEANERSKGVKWDAENQEVVTVDDEIFLSYDWDSDDENFGSKKVLIDLAGASELPQGPKVQDNDANSVFTRSTFRSQHTIAQPPVAMDHNSADSDDTPKTINKSTPTAATENMSSISDTNGLNHEILQRMEKMSIMISKLTQLIPDTPGNQAILAEIRSELPNSLSAGCSGESTAPSSSSGTGALPR